VAKITKINHVAIVVPDIENALGFWRDALGLELHHVEDVASQKSQVAFLPLGESEVELVRPTSDDSGVAKFLTERGAGMHHLCFEVDDIDGMLADLKAKGVRLINETAMQLEGRKVAFVHPKSSNGVLVELYQQT
jgi:methylmalonyl-CoA/ethylmalonyl-CoA epimerase